MPDRRRKQRFEQRLIALPLQRLIPGAFIVLSSLLFVAPWSIVMADNGNTAAREQSVMLSLLLKTQCDAEIAGFAERTASLYRAWRSVNRETIGRLEAEPEFLRRRQALEQLLPSLSQKTKAGIRKDCATMRQSWRQRFGR